jgi:hypothetical protein
LFWGGAGGVIGGLLGTAAYGGWWIGVKLGWWGITAGGAGGYGAVKLFNSVEVALAKLNYLLTDPGKFGGFSSLGYTRANIGTLQDLLISIGQKITSVDMSVVTQYGTKYEMAIEILGPNGVAGRLMTVWQIDHGANILRFITGWIEVF